MTSPLKNQNYNNKRKGGQNLVYKRVEYPQLTAPEGVVANELSVVNTKSAVVGRV